MIASGIREITVAATAVKKIIPRPSSELLMIFECGGDAPYACWLNWHGAARQARPLASSFTPIHALHVLTRRYTPC